MSLFLYRGRNGNKAARSLVAEADYEDLARMAKKTKGRTPENLRFEGIIKNDTLPPCSLNDFMDYLVYVEGNAEYLQFFMWYCDYVYRWSTLSRKEKALSRRWDPEGTRPSTSHSRSGSLEKAKVDAILDILENTGEDEEDEQDKRPDAVDEKWAHRKMDSTATNFSLPRNPARVASGVRSTRNSTAQWLPFGNQPLRQEVNSITRHYISLGAPRQLSLFPQERAACMHAVEHTTHPSALLPAFLHAEAVLRGQLHPNFIRWSMNNSNRPLLILLSLIGLVLCVLGCGVVAFFVLTPWPFYWRVTATPLLLMGVFFFVSARSGVEPHLHWSGRRQLRPWEQGCDAGTGSRKGYRGHLRVNTNDSIASIDPLRKTTMRHLGPKNGSGDEPWVSAYEGRFLWRRVFDVTIASQDNTLRRMRNRVLCNAGFWACGISIGLVIACLFIPSVGILKF